MTTRDAKLIEQVRLATGQPPTPEQLAMIKSMLARRGRLTPAELKRLRAMRLPPTPPLPLPPRPPIPGISNEARTRLYLDAFARPRIPLPADPLERRWLESLWAWIDAWKPGDGALTLPLESLAPDEHDEARWYRGRTKKP